MNDLYNFKTIADEVMGEIKASNELKKKTLNRCTNLRSTSIYKILIPAACLTLIIGMVNLSGILSHSSQIGESINPEVNILVGKGEGIARTLRIFKTLEDANEYFGEGFIVPSYITEGFKLDKISTSDSYGAGPKKLVLSYLYGDRSFLIIEERTIMQNQYEGFKQIDINGFRGYLKSEPLENNGGLGDSITEIHWVVDDVQYSVMGLLTEDEAIKVVLTLK